jgi:hypothetical protein
MCETCSDSEVSQPPLPSPFANAPPSSSRARLSPSSSR